MKNVYVLSTNKPSRLLYDKEESCYLPLQDKLVVMDHQHLVENRHIYITTSDSEIKEGDWFISTKSNNLFKADSIEYFKYYNLIEDFNKSFYLNSKNARKIIFTDDEDLINDGVQAVTDEFLEWFIKNPNCERVEVGYGFIKLTETDNKGYWISIFNAEFNIQEEEPKQETLEEVPANLESVLAKITHQNSLGLSQWYEVVYYDNKWCSYSGSKTFEDGERVIAWKYCKDLI